VGARRAGPPEEVGMRGEKPQFSGADGWKTLDLILIIEIQAQSFDPLWIGIIQLGPHLTLLFPI
jgi:hypothetical protein